MNWQPIKTAPKDGTRVLLHDNGNVVIGRWLPDAAFGEHQTGPGWQIFDCELDDWYAWAIKDPTEWMPVPDPPKTAQSHPA